MENKKPPVIIGGFKSGAGAGFEPATTVLSPFVITYLVDSSESQILRRFEAEGASSGELCTNYAPQISKVFAGAKPIPCYLGSSSQRGFMRSAEVLVFRL